VAVCLSKTFVSVGWVNSPRAFYVILYKIVVYSRVEECHSRVQTSRCFVVFAAASKQERPGILPIAIQLGQY
jgi:hypothetical protein